MKLFLKNTQHKEDKREKSILLNPQHILVTFALISQSFARKILYYCSFIYLQHTYFCTAFCSQLLYFTHAAQSKSLPASRGWLVLVVITWLMGCNWHILQKGCRPSLLPFQQHPNPPEAAWHYRLSLPRVTWWSGSSSSLGWAECGRML